ncbi:E3 ubiquitin-protein ligase RNF114 [Rhinoraja longicauda]
MGNTASRGGEEQMEEVVLWGAEDFQCPVCLQVLERPVRTQCGHVFCQECHETNYRFNGGNCPLCRQEVCLTDQVAVDIEQRMMSKREKCQGCGTEVRLTALREHARSCSRYLEEDHQETETCPLPPANPASHREPTRSPVANRGAYTCPYCHERNFDAFGLVDHCITNHYFDHHRAVCPICASMPWGIPNYYSRNLIAHLVLRHQFSYDYFVDYNQDEDVMLQSVILNSFQEN